METWDYRVLDVFSDRPLAGNQLAVFLDAARIPEALLQPLAREIGFAETVFVYPAESGGDARMRIFTPASELPFAGHPTLGTAILLAGELGRDQVTLETGRGAIPVAIEAAHSAAPRGTMQQPTPTISAYTEPEPLLRALGMERSLLPVTIYDSGIPHLFIMAESPAAVAALKPDLGAIADVSRGPGLRFVGCNVFSGSDLGWKMRMFAPADGIAEDSATGSAAGPLALHLARHGLVPWDTEIAISQGAEIGRPSTLLAKAALVDNQVGRIEVSGYAVAVGGGWFNGDLLRATVDDSA
jgi:trans-2,3-dihydro-3-hydroxyanthranilate isomerase